MLRVLVYRFGIATALCLSALAGAGWKWERMHP